MNHKKLRRLYREEAAGAPALGPQAGVRHQSADENYVAALRKALMAAWKSYTQ